MINVTVPAKIHLIGEYSPIYAKPAILSAIDKYCKVQIIPQKENNVKITSKNYERTQTFTFEEILEITRQANKTLEKFFELQDPQILKSIVQDDLHYPVIAIGETLLYYQKEKSAGFHLTIDSEMPINTGLGSSAALAVAVSAAVTKYIGEKIDKKVISEIAIHIETKIHGYPSGGDTSAVLYGGFIEFNKDLSGKKTIKPLDITISKEFAKNFFLINTGKAIESTGEMVFSVRELYKNNPEVVNEFLEDQEKQTYKLLEAMNNNDSVATIASITQAERNLEKIHIISQKAKELIREIEKLGGAAKISGAGGRKDGSGMAIVYAENADDIMSLLKKHSVSYLPIKLGAKGLAIKTA